ncbi:macrolide family glycosyltransferase [Allorhizocola rhizosphaerae]|uniref:macrolide family glycosyltransferase n=1 Tax=Allorhizocola rhizosphaerae TaxID=1872709 RepID=UPI0013C31CF2|nr:macrolide family glycosyltransferase [Allorhizocola rhizosphaerae]
MGKHIALFNIPAYGHVIPTIPVVEQLVARGHRVTYTSIEKRRPLLEAAGATVHAYGSLRPSDDDPTPQAPPRDGYISQSLLSFLDEAVNVWDQIAHIYREDPPDLILFDRMAFAGRVMAEALGVPSIQLWPMLVSNQHWAMGPVDPNDPVLQQYVAKLTAFLGEHCPSLEPAAFLSPTPARHMAFYPRSFQYNGELFDSSYAFVGPCLRRAEGQWRPSGDGPVLLATLGTVYNANAQFYRCVVEAFGETSWEVVIACGERIDVASMGALPSNVRAHRVVPQLDILSRASALVSHAGMGGIMEAMSFGVPVLAVPQTLEQEANAARIEELGLGARLSGSGPAALREAVELMVKDPAIADGIARMRADIAAAGGAARAADIVEECLP